MFDFIEAELGAGPFLLGETVSAADFFLLMLVMWGSRMARRPATLPRIGAHAARMLARPAVAAALAAEGLSPPFV